MQFNTSPRITKIVAALVLLVCFVIVSALSSTRADSVKTHRALSSQNLLSSRDRLEVKNLCKDQKLDLKVFVHLQKSEFAGFKSSQDVQLKEWETSERKARHQFFTDHPAGAERRVYIQSFMNRREELLRKMAVERAQKVTEQSSKLKSFRDEQDEEVKRLEEKLRAGQHALVVPISGTSNK
jgi:hypothetical protein